MATMATSFGVSVEFLDKWVAVKCFVGIQLFSCPKSTVCVCRELSKFISVKRVAAKIDKVGNAIANEKNGFYDNAMIDRTAGGWHHRG